MHPQSQLLQARVVTWEPRQSSWEPPSVPLCTCHIMMRLDRYQGANAATNSHTWLHTCDAGMPRLCVQKWVFQWHMGDICRDWPSSAWR
jgi:hypothetical protein